MELKENQICPICFCNMLMMYGCGWDYDRLICGDRDCDYEVEFESSTYVDEAQNEEMIELRKENQELKKCN